VVTDARTGEQLALKRYTWINPVQITGLGVVALLVAWLAINLEKTPDQFLQAFLIGITRGSVYALIALGYTLVYGILELINFAHGDLFMLGGMIAITLIGSDLFGLMPAIPRSTCGRRSSP